MHKDVSRLPEPSRHYVLRPIMLLSKSKMNSRKAAELMEQRNVHTFHPFTGMLAVKVWREGSLLSRNRATELESNFRTYQSQLEQLGDDPVEHPSVVFLVDLVCDFLDNVLRRQRRAVDLTETLGVI